MVLLRLCVFPNGMDFSPLEKLLPARTNVKCVSLSTARAEYGDTLTRFATFFLEDPSQFLHWKIFTNYYDMKDSIDPEQPYRIAAMGLCKWPRNNFGIDADGYKKPLSHLFKKQTNQDFVLTIPPSECGHFRKICDFDTILRFLHHIDWIDVDSSYLSSQGSAKWKCSCGRCANPDLPPLDRKELYVEFARPKTARIWDKQCAKCELVRDIRANEVFISCGWCKRGFHRECTRIEDTVPDGWICKGCMKNPICLKHLRSLHPPPPFKPIQVPLELAYLSAVPQWVETESSDDWFRCIVTEHVLYSTMSRKRADVLSKQAFRNPKSLFEVGYGTDGVAAKWWKTSPDTVKIYRPDIVSDAAFLVGWNPGQLAVQVDCTKCRLPFQLGNFPFWFYPAQFWCFCVWCYPVTEKHRLIIYPSQAKLDAYCAPQ